MSLRYAVIGTGAIGGYYGGKLARAGREVHFLLYSDYDYVKEHGLQVHSVKGDFHLSQVHAYRSTAEMPPCDVVLVCLKSTSNELLKDLLPPLLHPGTLVLMIQNGLGVEADLQTVFPDLQIAGGLAFICSAKTGPGEIFHLDYGGLNIGSYSCRDVIVLEEVVADLNASGVDARLLDLEQARWMKLVWNVPYNGLTVVLHTTPDRLMNHPASEALLKDLMLEVIRGANQSGGGRFTIDESYADKMLEMTRTMTPYSPSMKLDYDHHRPLEIHYIYTRPIQEAAKAGYEMKNVRMLEQQLRFRQANY
ncbi:MAG: putative 2-dehydropantoate 2-reductase [Tannerellaceae bacterium]|nr:putative 2-dehydropantoate 2-reductase [Tannerellaceae bacterium]